MLTSVLILFLSPVWGITPVCQNQVQEHGDGKGISEVSFTCMREYRKRALPQAWKIGTMNFFAVGAKDLIMVHGKYDTNVIAGSNTNLREVGALAIDFYNDEIVVYDRESDNILFFSRTITGNVSPFRTLSDQRLRGTVDLAIDGIKGELYALNQENGEILVYSRMANIHARKGKKNLNLLRKITEIPQEVHSMGIASNHREIYLLSNDKIASYSLNNIDLQLPLWEIAYSAKKDTSSLNYLHDNDKLLVYREGRKMYFSRNNIR